MSNTGDLSIETKREGVFTVNHQFYLYHHIIVLGMEEGALKVSNKLDAPLDAVKKEFYRLHKKQKAHQTAI